jgi:hypothetical protein
MDPTALWTMLCESLDDLAFFGENAKFRAVVW